MCSRHGDKDYCACHAPCAVCELPALAVATDAATEGIRPTTPATGNKAKPSAVYAHAIGVAADASAVRMGLCAFDAASGQVSTYDMLHVDC